MELKPSELLEMTWAEFQNYELGYAERLEREMRRNMENAVFGGYYAGGYFNDPRKMGNPGKIIDKMFKKELNVVNIDEAKSINKAILEFNRQIGINK